MKKDLQTGENERNMRKRRVRKRGEAKYIRPELRKQPLIARIVYRIIDAIIQFM